MNRLVRVAPIAGAVLVSAVLLVRASLALASGHDLNHVSGVWLALALDASDGRFYRALMDAGAYGGTRYFPLLFLLAAGGMRLGLPAVAAGQMASLLGAGLLASGAFMFLVRLGVGRSLSAVGAVLVLAPYFVQESILSIRVEPLATGLALWGLAWVADRLGAGVNRRWTLYSAAAFALAVAAKPTSVFAAGAAILALMFARRQRDAVGLVLLCAAFWALLTMGIWVFSSGRAIQAFRAGALAGETPLALLGLGALLRPFHLVLTSSYLTAVLALVVAALATAPRDLVRLPGLLVLFAALAAAAALGTPGTILTNQIVEPYAATALYLVWVAHTRVSWHPVGHGLIAALLVWTAVHQTRQLVALSRDDAWNAARADRAALVGAWDRCDEPVLAESPLVSIFADRRPILLDPFAFRVAALTHPELADDLIARLDRREFGCVILELDPQSDPGRGWYRNVHLGEQVVDALLRRYEYRGTVAGRRFYTPAPD